MERAGGGKSPEAPEKISINWCGPKEEEAGPEAGEYGKYGEGNRPLDSGGPVQNENSMKQIHYLISSFFKESLS